MAIAGENTASPGKPARLALQLHYAGKGFEYFRLWIVDSLLVLLTLGFYAPWAWLRQQQYFASRIRVEGITSKHRAQVIPIGTVWSLAGGPLTAMAGLAVGLMLCFQLPGTGLLVLTLAGLLLPLADCIRLRLQAGHVDWGPQLACLHYRSDASAVAAIRSWLPLLILPLAIWLALVGWSWLPSPGSEDEDDLWFDSALAACLLAALLIAAAACQVAWQRDRYRQTTLQIGLTRFRPSLRRGRYVWISLGAGLAVIALASLPGARLIYLVATDPAQQLTPEMFRAVYPYFVLIPLLGWMGLISPWLAARRQYLLAASTATPRGAVRFTSRLKPGRFIVGHCLGWLLTLATAGFYLPFALTRQMRLSVEALRIELNPGVLEALGSRVSMSSPSPTRAGVKPCVGVALPSPALAAMATLLVVGLMVASALTGLSGVTRELVALVPMHVDESIGAWVDRVLAPHVKVPPSQLPAGEQSQILAFVNNGLNKAFPDGRLAAVRIELIGGGETSALAAANLANTVYVSDGFYRLGKKMASNPCVKDPRDLVLAVVAHEIGHWEQRAIVSKIVNMAITGVTTRVWLGDWTLAASSFLIRQPFELPLERFERYQERDADLRSISILKAAGVSPGIMAEVYERHTPKGHDAEPRGYPSDRSRAEMFREAADCAGEASAKQPESSSSDKARLTNRRNQ